MAGLRRTVLVLGALALCLATGESGAQAGAPSAAEESVWFKGTPGTTADGSEWDDPEWNSRQAPLATDDGALEHEWEEDADPRALTDFRPQLDPYGNWHRDARYGLVWVPSRQVVGDHFAPYLTHGFWSLDTNGSWIWVSELAFGSVVFHYGRWVWVVGVGWSWVPGYRYSPAWVVWRVPRHGHAYVGWAPMPPSYVWVDGVALGLGFHVSTPWVFCPSRHVFSRHLHRHHVRGPQRIERIARHTEPYHPAGALNGPTPRQAGVPPRAAPKVRFPARHLRPRVSAPGRNRVSLPARARGGAGSPSSQRDFEGYFEQRPRRITPAGSPTPATRGRAPGASPPRATPPRAASTQGHPPRARSAVPKRATSRRVLPREATLPDRATPKRVRIAPRRPAARGVAPRAPARVVVPRARAAKPKSNASKRKTLRRRSLPRKR